MEVAGFRSFYGCNHSSPKHSFMESNESKPTTNRRNFIGTLATGAAAMSLATIAAPLQAVAKQPSPFPDDDPDAFFNKLKGKHRMVFDVTEPNGMLPFAWPRIFLMTNPPNDGSAVVVLRHNAIPFAMDTSMWTKYKFGEMFKVNDDVTKTTAVRNAFWKPSVGDFKVPGVGNVAIGINELQDSGVLFCVCNVALTVFSTVTAQGMGMTPEDVKKDWVANLLPGIKVMPSGVWAVGRAQEHGCNYCYAGG
jgi:intracellular sulfur oxidation DsrE/DsrF family protein